LREDREYGVSSKTGRAYFIYSGVCQVCAASWKFDKRDILPEDKDDKEFVRRELA
jgi:hypothetical protein